MISRTFIDRPVLAWVISILIMLGGLAGIRLLPVEQYPDIAPPSVNVRANYPGASAETLESSVTQIIEQQLTGIDGLIYFSSSSSASGTAMVTLTFQQGTDADIAQVQVQNKVQQALPRLPQAVQQQGLVVTKSNPDFLLIMAVYDETDRQNSADVADYLVSNLQDPIGRIEGVGDFNVFGSQYSMRIWLDPAKLASFNLMPGDVISAVQAQNTQVAAGQIGSLPAPVGQRLNATVTARSRLTSPDEFRRILVKTQPDGSAVRVGDVARVELGSENYGTLTRLNGHPGAGMAVQLAPGADALRTSELVKAAVVEAAKQFPPGYKYAFPLDSTQFVKLSIEEVVKTLVEAIILVVIVMFVFLQSWRATLIPAIAVPVVLLGTFGALAAFGFSINTLTLFGTVLAIGLLVDDAIVVVENVERVMREDPEISPREATIRSMGEIQTALIAIALVLSAVFLPMAFFGGSVGTIYRQFSITMVASMLLSVVVALVLSPALAATLLHRPADELKARRRQIVHTLHRHGDRFQAGFEKMAEWYRGKVERVIHHGRIATGVYLLLVLALVAAFWILPKSFLPAEDQGRAQLQYTLPPGATMERTLGVVQTVEKYFKEKEPENVQVIFLIVGQSQAGAGQNAGRGFVAFAPWDERKGQANSAQGITQRATKSLGGRIRDAEVFALNPPPVRGLGQSSGFTMELLNSGNLSRAEFKAARDKLLAAARGDDTLTNVRVNVLEDTPTLSVDIDQEKVGALGLAQHDVDTTLTAAWAGNYVNDFVDRGRVKRVYIQGDGQFRSRPEDLDEWHVRNANGAMTPFSAFASTSWKQAPVSVSRYNGLSSYEIQGAAAAGRSTGDSMDRMEQLAAEIPGVSYEWSGLSYQERLSSGQAPYLYLISLLVVFLCLAALYESWSIPVSVLLVVPLGLLGAALAVFLRGLENDVYFQVGLLTTMGLSAKNAILIVEFAEQYEKRGESAVAAALAAARTRLRPILMTSLAFIFGVLPLAISTGAGAHSRNAIGTAVIGGMVTGTVLAVFFVPLAYVGVRRAVRRLSGRATPAANPVPPDPPAS
ncbi:MAG TPA: efflux RND transporter permease subunit [Steroidobacteraceae bacterium]|nr:efflux RND transporter permease subunit [Steroidobacteraceae bacterium]